MLNKQEIMKNAWVAAQNAVHFHGGQKAEYFAACLKAEWAFQKMINVPVEKKEKVERVELATKEIVEIKSWFVRKNFDADQAYLITNNDWIEVKEETVKAYKLVVHNADFGNITTWVPKSCCVA